MSTYIYDIVGAEALEEFLASRKELVLIDFRAERCGPCRMLGPILHEIADNNPGKIVIAKVDLDVDENQPLAETYAVTSIPQVTFVKNNAVVDQFVGAWPADKVQEMVEKHMDVEAEAEAV